MWDYLVNRVMNLNVSQLGFASDIYKDNRSGTEVILEHASVFLRAAWQLKFGSFFLTKRLNPVVSVEVLQLSGHR